MDHLKILGIKFVAISITVLSIFGMFNHVSLGSLMVISALTTAVSYLVGDMFILRRFGNVTASIADFALAFATLWILSALVIGSSFPIATTSLLAAFFIACVEPFVHEYIVTRFPEMRKDNRGMNQLETQTEFAEEPDVHDIRSKDDDFDGEKL